MITAINSPSTRRAAAAVGMVYKSAPVADDRGRGRAENQARAADERPRAVLRNDARRAAATPAAAMLACLIHRMGGANTSAARGAYVNLRI